MMNGKMVGKVQTNSTAWASFSADIAANAGKFELTLAAENDSEFEIAEIVPHRHTNRKLKNNLKTNGINQRLPQNLFKVACSMILQTI